MPVVPARPSEPTLLQTVDFYYTICNVFDEIAKDHKKIKVLEKWHEICFSDVIL
jgi:hypothetical protein